MSEPIVTVTWWNAMPYAKEGKYFNFWEAKITERKSFTKSRTPTKLDFPSTRAISLNPILIHYLNHATAFFSVILLWVSFSNLDLCPRCIAFCLESRYSLFPASVCLCVPHLSHLSGGHSSHQTNPLKAFHSDVIISCATFDIPWVEWRKAMQGGGIK